MKTLFAIYLNSRFVSYRRTLSEADLFVIDCRYALAMSGIDTRDIDFEIREEEAK